MIRLGLALGSKGDAFKAQRVKEPLGESLKRETKKEVERPLFGVIRLGLEPKTPTLKVLCSTD